MTKFTSYNQEGHSGLESLTCTMCTSHICTCDLQGGPFLAPGVMLPTKYQGFSPYGFLQEDLIMFPHVSLCKTFAPCGRPNFRRII